MPDSSINKTGHIPVLLNQFLQYTNIPGKRIWDGTAGAGGHLKAFMREHANWEIFASDTDAEMLAICRANLASESNQIHFAHDNFANNPFAKSTPFNVIFLDLGISSLHLDTLQRGISYREDSFLDMRLNQKTGITAADFLNKASEQEIKAVLYKFSEEKFAPAIARNIVQERQKKPLQSTSQLAEICVRSYPQKVHKRGQSHTDRHPYVKTFQALRIHVNDELGVLERALMFLPDLLAPQGRLLIISFHSLEDRLVKNFFRSRCQIKQHAPDAKSNFLPGNFRELTRKPVTAAESEIQNNQRARSAKLRVLERIA